MQIREIVDAAGAPAYDAFSYDVGSSCIFVACTTEVVAWTVQHRLECEDPTLHEALQTALAETPPARPSAAKKPRRRKTAKKA